MCGKCEHKHSPWKNWDGAIEVHEVWADEHGGVHHVATTPAPEGVDVEIGVYGHDGVEGGVFWIADFPIAARDTAMELVGQLEGMWAAKVAADKEIARMTECLEQPVGYINQHDLEILRSTGEVEDVTICTKASGYHNAAIYAQD